MSVNQAGSIQAEKYHQKYSVIPEQTTRPCYEILYRQSDRVFAEI